MFLAETGEEHRQAVPTGHPLELKGAYQDWPETDASSNHEAGLSEPESGFEGRVSSFEGRPPSLGSRDSVRVAYMGFAGSGASQALRLKISGLLGIFNACRCGWGIRTSKHNIDAKKRRAIR